MPFDNIELFPYSADINDRDRLTIGGCDAVELADEFGTPLLVFDDATLRGMCRRFVDAFGSRYPNSQRTLRLQGIRKRRHREDRCRRGTRTRRRLRRRTRRCRSRRF